MLSSLLLALVAIAPVLADYHIKVKDTDLDLCVDDTNGSLNDGNHLQVWTCFRGNTNQAWRFDQNPMVATQFQFGTTGKCLAVQETANGNLLGQPVVLAGCTAPGYRTWFYRVSDYMCILNTNGCVQLADVCPDNGTGLKIAVKANPPALQFFDYTTPAN